MHSKSDNIEIVINDEADEVIEELFKSTLNRYQNNLQKLLKKVVSLSLIMLIYCIINAIK